MKVREILKEKGREILTVNSETSVTDASYKMFDRKIGALLVEEDGSLAGIITERDIVCIVAKTEGELRGLKVRDIMIKRENLLVAEPDDEESYVMAVMIQKNVRHMPIVESGEIVGFLSIRDVVKAHVKKLTADVHFLTEYIR